MGLIRSDLLGRPVGDVEIVCDDALTIVDNPGRYPEGLYYQARGVLHSVQYLRGRTVLIEGLPSPPTSIEDIRDMRAVMYHALTMPDAAPVPWPDTIEAMGMWMMLGFVLGDREESPFAEVATRAA